MQILSKVQKGRAFVGLLAFIFSGSQAATQIVGGEAFLQGQYAEVGVRPNGSFGSTSIPAGFHANANTPSCLGFVISRNKDGWDTASGAIIDGDFFCPGTPLENWNVSVNGTVGGNNNSTDGVPGQLINLVAGGPVHSVQWKNNTPFNGLDILQTYSIEDTGHVISIDVTLTNTTTSTLNNVSYVRSLDPDDATGDNSSTPWSNTYDSTNTVVSQIDPSVGSATAVVSGTFPSGGEIALASTSPGAIVAISNTFDHSPTADSIINNTGTWDNTVGATITDDKVFGLAFDAGNIGPGESVTFSLSYLLSSAAIQRFNIVGSVNDPSMGTITCTPSSVTAGGNSSCTATPTAGHFFQGFTGDCTGTSCNLTNINSDKVVTAVFAPEYTITATASPASGGSVTCTNNSVPAGGNSSCTATPNAGYVFSGFTGDCIGTLCDLTNINANKTVTANFIAEYSVTATASPASGGSVTCTNNSVPAGGNSSCTAAPNSGYTFEGFTGDCTGTSCNLTNINANKTVTANFKLMPSVYSVTATASPASGGSVTCTNNSVPAGGNSSCTVAPNSGYTFEGFTGDCTGASCNLTNINANKTVTANFKLIPSVYSVTATASPASGGSVICTNNSVPSGGNSSCVAEANIGYTFDGFSVDCTGKVCDLDNINSDKAIVANFSLASLPVPNLSIMGLLALVTSLGFAAVSMVRRKRL